MSFTITDSILKVLSIGNAITIIAFIPEQLRCFEAQFMLSYVMHSICSLIVIQCYSSFSLTLTCCLSANARQILYLCIFKNTN